MSGCLHDERPLIRLLFSTSVLLRIAGPRVNPPGCVPNPTFGNNAWTSNMQHSGWFQMSQKASYFKGLTHVYKKLNEMTPTDLEPMS